MSRRTDAVAPRPRAPGPHVPAGDVAGERRPPTRPVEPGQGATPAHIRDDAERDRLVDPANVRPQEGPRTTKAPRSAPGLALPHERDESPEPSTVAPDPVIAQAKRDIDAGLVDTDMRATPGLDAQRRAQLVPGPGGKPPSGH